MTAPAFLFNRSIDSPADAAALEAAARRIETPCGEASMVWHVWGEEEDNPVVLLHGGSGSWNHWARNIGPLVRAGRSVCVPDLPGFGDSARPPVGRDADALPQWVERGLAELLGDTACDIVGFSFGAMVAAFLAAQWPQRARRLVLVGAPALMNEPDRQLGLKSWSHLPDEPEREAVIRHNLAQLMLARDASIDELAIALHTANLLRDRMPRRRISKTDVLARTLPQVQCPVWGLWGGRDALYRDRLEIVEPALAKAPRFESLTLLEGAGHWVQYEDAEAFNEALARVLSAPVPGTH